MGYVIGGVDKDSDAEGYLLEPDYSDEAVQVIAAAEGIELSEDHLKVIAFMRDKYREEGHTPNFRNMLKEVSESILPGCDSKALYDLFPTGPAKQSCKIGGLPQPYGKGGY